MSKIPEHLLERSRARRAALGLGGDEAAAPIPTAGDAPSTAPATTAAAAAPAGPTAEFSTPAKPKAAAKPPAPHIVAATTRPRVPVWAVSVLAFLPIWAIIYVATLSPAGGGGLTPLAAGAEAYANPSIACGGCHGAGGGGGAGPAFTNGAIVDTFPDPADHLLWVELGSDGWKAEVGSTYGANDKPVKGGMPGFGDTVEIHELLFIVRHERENLGGEEFDPEVWTPILEELEAAGEIDAAFIELFLTDGIVTEGGGGGGGH